MPTTTASMQLWNGELPGKKSYIISTIGIKKSLSAGAALIYGLAVQLNTTNPIPPPTGIAELIAPLFGSGNRLIQIPGNYPTKAILTESEGINSITVIDDGAWHFVGKSGIVANTSNQGFSVDFSVYGRYIIPPQGAFSIASMANIVPAAHQSAIYITWHEVQL
jgi:hypothetical protein